MTTGAKIALGITIPLILAGGGIVAWKILSKPTKDQHQELQDNFNRAGSDVFKGLNPREIAETYVSMKKNLTKKEMQKLVELSSIPESEWTTSDSRYFERTFLKGVKGLKMNVG